MKKRSYLSTIALFIFILLGHVNVHAESYTYLSNGTYTINSALSTSLMIDITGKNTGNGLVVWNQNGGENQEFILNHVENGWYKITNRGSNKVIDLSLTGIVEKGSKLILNDYSGDDSQLWRFYSAGNNYYYIQNKTGYYLDVYGGANKAGTIIQAFTRLNQYNQMWKLVSADNNCVKITGRQYYFQTALNENLVMDITGYKGEGNRYEDGHPLVLWDANNGRNQRFNIELDREDWYKIVNESTGKVVTIEGGKGVKSEKISLYTYDGSDAQMFRFYDAGNGFYYIKNKLGYYWDVYNGIGNAGQELITFPLNKQTNQKWRLLTVNIGETSSSDNPVSSQYTLVSQSEINRAANTFGISQKSNAYSALLSVNTKYYEKLKDSKNGTLVFMFEGVGSNESSALRMNAMCVVIKNGVIKYINKNCSTIPDRPFDKSSNKNKDVPTVKAGVYDFKSHNHHPDESSQSDYAALKITNARAIRFEKKGNTITDSKHENLSSINVHGRWNNGTTTAETPDSAGCILIGNRAWGAKGNVSQYLNFCKSVGILRKERTTMTYKTHYDVDIKGKIIIDRSYATNYLRAIGYPSKTLQDLCIVK